ncbi:MAG: 1,4-dihydroxy-6-naphthoate synthase [Solitalea-like symbiont of Acarus siro]
MNFKLSISPCPNDTFIFDAIINKKIDTLGFEFEVYFHDIEELNERAKYENYDITKLSCFSYFNVMDKYVILNSGAALGFGVGPLLISNAHLDLSQDRLSSHKVLLPGVNTTANFLFTYAYPNLKNKFFSRFDLIENAIVSQQFDLGVIIHEGRFTYLKKGLNKICDLGAVWQDKTNMPVPLGCIAIKRGIDKTKAILISDLIAKSIEYAFKNPEDSLDFTRKHAQELEYDTIKKHINLYVNKFSIDLGNQGKEALLSMYDFACRPENGTIKSDSAQRKLFL